MQYNKVVDGQRRQSRRDRAPHPSVYSVCSRLLPEAGCRHFSCTDNQIAKQTARTALRTGNIARLSSKYKKGPVHCGRIP